MLKVYPAVANYPKEDLKKAMTLIEHLNPFVSYKSVRDKKTKERTDSYMIEPGKVILVPDESQLLKAPIPAKKL